MKIIFIIIICLVGAVHDSYAASFVLSSHDSYIPTELVYQGKTAKHLIENYSLDSYDEQYSLLIPKPSERALYPAAVEVVSDYEYKEASKFFTYRFYTSTLAASQKITTLSVKKPEFQFPLMNAYLLSKGRPAPLYFDGIGEPQIETEKNILRSYIDFHLQFSSIEKLDRLKAELFSVYFLEMERTFNRYCTKTHSAFLSDEEVDSSIVSYIQNAMQWVVANEGQPAIIRKALETYFSGSNESDLFQHGENVFITVLSYIYCDLHYAFNSLASSPNLRGDIAMPQPYTIYYGEHLGVLKNFLINLSDSEKNTLFNIVDAAISSQVEQKVHLIKKTTFLEVIGRIDKFSIIILKSIYNHILSKGKYVSNRDKDVSTFCEMATEYAKLKNGGIKDEELASPDHLNIPLKTYKEWCR